MADHVAKCACGKFGKSTGLGVMGVGVMWFELSDAEQADESFQALPVEPCGGFGHSGSTYHAKSWAKTKETAP